MKAGPKALTAAKVRAVLRKAGLPRAERYKRRARVWGRTPGYVVKDGTRHSRPVTVSHHDSDIAPNRQAEAVCVRRYIRCLTEAGIDVIEFEHNVIECRGYLSPEGGEPNG